MTRLSLFPALFLLLLVAAPVHADQSLQFGDYVVHYNAFNSEVLDPRIAGSYGIQRSPKRGVLMVNVQRAGAVPGGIRAGAQATARNAVVQSQQVVELREVKEGDGYYYVADFPVSNGEILDFHISVQPEGAGSPYAFDYRQQFFTREP